MTQLSALDTAGAAHVSAGDLAAFLDNRLACSSRVALLAHCSACDHCRRELTEMRAVLRTHRTRGLRGPLMAISGIAAALLIAVPLARRTPLTGDGVRTRATADSVRLDALQTIPIVRLNTDSLVSAAAPSFAWHSAGIDATYRVMLQDTSGGVVWSASTSDTVAALPATARLVAGQRYFWSVDARLIDGRSATTGLHRVIAH